MCVRCGVMHEGCIRSWVIVWWSTGSGGMGVVKCEGRCDVLSACRCGWSEVGRDVLWLGVVLVKSCCVGCSTVWVWLVRHGLLG